VKPATFDGVDDISSLGPRGHGGVGEAPRKEMFASLFLSLSSVTSLLSDLISGQEVDDREIERELMKARRALDDAAKTQKEMEWEG